MPARIYHNNGHLNLFVDQQRLEPNLGPVWFRLLERRMRRDRRLAGSLSRPPGLDIVLCTTFQQRLYTERVLQHLGISDYVVLGRELERWRHICKMELIVQHIREHPEPGLLLHLDAPDVLVTGGLDPVVETFRAMQGCDLLFGAEKNSAPGSQTAGGLTAHDRQFLARIEQFETATYPAPFQHLNAGCFIGRKDAILDLFSQALQQRKSWGIDSRLPSGDLLIDDDQFVLREMHRQNHPRVRADHANEIFQNLYATRRSEVSSDPPLPGGLPFASAFAGHRIRHFARRVGRFFRYSTRRMG